MADATLAGLPRLVRVAEEVRWRGQAAMAVALAVASYWAALWLLDRPVKPLETTISFATVGILTAGVSSLASRRRLHDGLVRTTPPPRPSVYETHADGRERRARLAGIVLFGVVVLLVFDRLTDGG